MKRATKVLASLAGVVLSAALLTPMAQAQQAPGAPGAGGGQRPGGPGGRGGFARAVTLSGIPAAALKTPLKLTDDQVTKIEAIQTKLGADRQALFAPPADGSQPDRAGMMQKMQALSKQADTDVLAVLDDTQKKAVPGMLKDIQVYNAAGIPLGAISQINLTADQKKQIQAIVADENKKLQTALTAAAGDQDKTRQARQDSRMAIYDKVQTVLTADQKTALDDYIKAHPQRGRGGRRGGGAPGAPGAPGA